ncbi:MAG TPA: Flp pilus assembly protein CpaB [Candidatus Limnocylindria bacterium]|nr:Flp pilus assembly protein CpaB [Candidatus Limnocylindria bacterium]
MQDGSRRRARLILIVGVALALVAGVGTFVYASGAKSDQPVAVPTVAVLVAAREIPAKTTLTAADVKLQEYNVDAKPAAAMTSPEEALGKITVQTISVGEPILPTKFSDPKLPGFVVMPANLIGPDGAPLPNSPNFRAMSITVPDQNAVGGTLVPGDLVDMVYTLQFDPATKVERPTPQQVVDFSAKIILERLPILARLASTYTVRLDTLTAERVAYLQASGGQIQLLLRAPKDERASGSIGATFRDVQGALGFKIPTKIQ